MEKTPVPFIIISAIFLLLSISNCKKQSPSIPTATPEPTACGIVCGNSADDDDDSFSNGILIAVSFTASTNCTLTTLSCKSSSSTGQIAMGIYSDNSGVPGTLLAQTPGNTPVTGWNSITITPLSIVSGVQYWLAVIATSSPGPRCKDAGGYCIHQPYIYYNTDSLPVNPAGWSNSISDPYPKVYATGCN